MKQILFLTGALLIASLASAQAADAKENYDKLCLKCHGADGKGDTKLGKKMGVKDYSSAKIQDALKDAEALKALKEGLKEKGTDKTLMKPVEGLTEQEIKELLVMFRKFKK